MIGIDQIFTEVNHVLFASASVAQVQATTTHDGESCC
ncbi:hypothetical protein BRADI_1g51586v3 [Brachypodium distachyon]|uniref:Uncharacterized protein n=1 Tax=Brachypodium distachyon TaxID=15368 RepID=A0A0Q3HAL5_BRADI|nr:hypothetical protein BRADI_1g51586v3 [Brachypodium distachyon]